MPTAAASVLRLLHCRSAPCLTCPKVCALRTASIWCTRVRQPEPVMQCRPIEGVHRLSDALQCV